MFSLIRTVHKTLKVVMGLLKKPQPHMCPTGCSKFEAVDDLSVDFEQCGKRTHMLWQDPVADLLIISSCPDHLLIRFMLFHTTLVDTTHIFYCAGLWNSDGYPN